MIKNLLYLLVLAVIGWVVYVSFFGKPDDIKLRNNLLSKGKELGMAVSDIFQSETKKVNSGEYKQVFNKLNETLDELKKASKNKEHDDEITRLSEEKERLENSIKENEGNQTKLSEENKKLQILADDIVNLTKKIEG
jgi:predicted ribosome quality control (RQC) complex YloA/Tae2 family protein